jgi:DNA-binding transcriptional LysR family regulator
VVVQNLVAAGLGVTMLPRSALDAYRHPQVRAVPGFGLRRMAAVHRDGAAAVPATAAVLRALARLA